jgi:imidazolonepropionase-like amidohydrolase
MSNRRAEVLVATLAGLLAPVAQAQQSWALDAAKIYLQPDMPAISGQVVIAGTQIQSVKPASDRRDMATRAPQCNGGVVVAGFQNSHVHFMGDEFRDASHQRADLLDLALTRMLTRYGYTTVFDIASDRDNTLALRNRIEDGEVRGPRILTAGWALFPPHGLPIYISHLRKELLDKLPQPNSVDEALQVVRANFAAGADGTKLFLVTPQGDDKPPKRMPPDIASAAVAETHRRSQLVFAHPTDIQGVRAALDARVDILAHPPLGAPIPWPESLMKQVRDAGISMIPTLKLLEFELKKDQVPAPTAERLVNENATELGKFAALGGQVLFGTDVGYMTDYDPAREYELMTYAGLTPMQILASLTTTPAARWQEPSRRGRIAAGLDADIVVLDADPADSPRNFAAVRCVIRGGKVIYPTALAQRN